MVISLSYHNLSLHHGDDAILESVDLRLNGPGIFALLGPSGVGKSSFLRVTQRLIQNRQEGWRREGDVRFNGRSIFCQTLPRQELARQIGFIRQNPRMLAGSVRSNVEFALRHTTRHTRREVRRIAADALEQVGLADELPSLKFAARKLSGGQAQRLAIARAIALDPKVLLMDEPTASLDPLMAERVEEIMKRLANDRLLIVVTHDTRLTVRVADTAAFMFRGQSGGRIVEHGPVPEVIELPGNPTVREFVRLGRQENPSSVLTHPVADAREAPSERSRMLSRLLRVAIGAAGARKPLRRLYLFVCGGNTFRSPLAQAFCNDEIAGLLDLTHEELESAGIRAVSAGLSATTGTPIDRKGIEVLSQMGITPPEECAQQLDQSLLEQADVIVCMTRGQRDALLQDFPSSASRVVLLDENADIPGHNVATDNVLPMARFIRDRVRDHLTNDLTLHLAGAQ